MSNQTLSTSLVDIGGFTLSITTRHVGDNIGVMKELTLRTIGAFLHLAAKIQRQEFDLTEAEMGSVESRYLAAVQKDFPDAKLADAWGDARVTIWDKKGLNFHLNSDDDFQVAIDTWRAHKQAIQEALEKFAPPARQDVPPQPTPTGERPATPKGQNAPQKTHSAKNGYSPEDAQIEEQLHNHEADCYTRKEALDALDAPAEFNMQICKIMKRSQDGNEYYEFYHKYGQNPGKFPELRLYSDNEVALKNGLLDSLDGLALKPGQDKLGEWILKCRVAENAKKGENVVYPLALSG